MWIVFLDISPSFTDAFVAAKALGAKVLWLSLMAFPQSIADEGGPTSAVKLDTWEPDQAIAAIRRFVSSGESVAVWALNERLVPLAAQLNEQLRAAARWPSLRTIWTTKNKLLLRQALEGTGLNPRFAVINRANAASHPFPGTAVVVKPLEGDSSIGVELLKSDVSEGDFATATSRSFSVLEFIAKAVKGGRPDFVPDASDVLLVEEFVGGLEYSVEVFVTPEGPRVMGICGKSPMLAPYFEEISYLMPAPVSPDNAARLGEAALAATRALGLTTGMAHIELKDGPTGPKILDIGLRFGGGGLTHRLIKAAFGVDMVQAVLSELMMLPTAHLLTPTKRDTALLFLLQVGPGGVIEALPRAVQVPNLPDPILEDSFVQVGDKLTPYPAYSGTPGFALFSIAGQDASSANRAQQVVAECLKSLQFKYSSEREEGQ